MGKAENKIAHPVRSYAIERGFEVRKVSYESREGCPDYMFYGYGELFFIEFKSPDGTLRSNQVREIKRLRANGTRVFIIDNIEDGRDVVDGCKAHGETK